MRRHLECSRQWWLCERNCLVISETDDFAGQRGYGGELLCMFGMLGEVANPWGAAYNRVDFAAMSGTWENIGARYQLLSYLLSAHCSRLVTETLYLLLLGNVAQQTCQWAGRDRLQGRAHKRTSPRDAGVQDMCSMISIRRVCA